MPSLENVSPNTDENSMPFNSESDIETPTARVNGRSFNE
jgi:hypothetical protein